MPPFRNPSIRRLFTRAPQSSSNQSRLSQFSPWANVQNNLTHPRHQLLQRRWARVHDVRFLATHAREGVLQEQILERYKEKLDRKAKEEGHKSISDLKSAYKERIARTRKSSSPQPTTPDPPLSISPSSPQTVSSELPPPPTSSQQQKPIHGIQPLSSILDIPKTLTLPPDSIAELWRLRHAADPNSLSATIPKGTWERMRKTARRHPQFVVPVLKESGGAAEGTGQEAADVAGTGLTKGGRGYEMHFLEWAWWDRAATVAFTNLAEYKLRAWMARPHTVMTMYEDLVEEKGFVLATGSVNEKGSISVDEARWLVMCLQRFYAWESNDGGGRRQRLLELFTKGDKGFQIMELVEEAESV